VYTGDWRLYVPLHEMDLKSGMRPLTHDEREKMPRPSWSNLPMRIVRGLF